MFNQTGTGIDSMNTPSPIVQVDTREQSILPIEAYRLETVTLPVGDYGIRGFSDWNNPRFIVERKSLDDLVSSLTGERDRFMREIEKLRQFGFRAILVEGLEAEIHFRQYRSLARPQSILASLAAIQTRANVHVIWCGDPTGAARSLERLVRQFVRGIEKDAKRLNDSLAEKEIAPCGAV
ncbi:MAG: hypothetical protein AMXMBFR82_03080 [Candidatus Hydrogenedentota bacterium]